MNEIDECILASCRSNWLKVARVIYDAREKAGMANDNDSDKIIAERLCALVQAGRLEAQGNLENWRGSEVRLIA